MREFDTTFIVQPEISEEARETLIGRLKGVLERSGAVPLEVDDMGKRKLAYEIARFQKGHYLSLFYADSGKAVAELERALRIDESILRFLTVRRADDVGDLDARRAKAVELEKVRHEKAAERAAREAEERAAREAARLAGEPVDEGGGEEEEEYGVREPRSRDEDDDDEGDDRAPAGE
ncbi:MAG: 30S ribosomal protein S6 [Sorangiineae bacterium]|nr:30S ribosomal protein S6 [Sorangiineae bacterium]MEB2344040.1 30S ribosomal protein S6 [Deltaproteobacteria bacterium]